MLAAMSPRPAGPLVVAPLAHERSSGCEEANIKQFAYLSKLI